MVVFCIFRRRDAGFLVIGDASYKKDAFSASRDSRETCRKNFPSPILQFSHCLQIILLQKKSIIQQKYHNVNSKNKCLKNNFGEKVLKNLVCGLSELWRLKILVRQKKEDYCLKAGFLITKEKLCAIYFWCAIFVEYKVVAFIISVSSVGFD